MSRMRVFTVLLGVCVSLLLAFLLTRAYGARRWAAYTAELRSDLAAAAAPAGPSVVDFAELEGLPAPVQRFFRAVMKDGQRVISRVHLRHVGTFNMSETDELWRAFASDQMVVVRRPGFDWNGQIAMFPGLPVRVHDAYVAGEGLLHASLLGLVTLAHSRGPGAIAEGELVRFLAEAAWYPTALLPSQGVRWAEIDDRSASATLTDGAVAVTLRFSFSPEGPIDAVSAEARARMVGQTLVPTPWQGRFWNYEVRDGVRVPLNGEVAWLLPEGTKPYWRGRTTDISFAFAP